MGAPTVRLRPVTVDDEKRLFEWANDPAVRRAARNRAAIPWDEHRAWFRARLESAECRIWIAEADGVPAGQVRLDRDADRAEIDISVAGHERGKGIGLAMLNGLPSAPWPGLRRLTAAVRRDNARSLDMFRRGGFSEVSRDADFVHFAKDLGDG